MFFLLLFAVIIIIICLDRAVHDGDEAVRRGFRAHVGPRVAGRPVPCAGAAVSASPHARDGARRQGRTEEVVDEAGLSDRVLPNEEDEGLGI